MSAVSGTNIATMGVNTSKLAKSGVGMYFGERAARKIGVDAARAIASVSREVAASFGENIGVGAMKQVKFSIVISMN